MINQQLQGILMLPRAQGLFERWIALERSTGRSMGDILADLNAAAGTKYKHNWLSVVASRGYELERCPVEVRRYMLRKVLQDELAGMGFEVNQRQVEALTLALT
jgi:hypothetical protein